MTRCRILIALVLLPLTCSGCAVLDRENTLLLNWTEERVVPESTELQAVTAPFTFTLGLAAVTADMFIVNPARSLDDAAEDSVDILWDNAEWDERYVTECALLPMRTALTPPFYTGALLIRSFITGPDEEEADAPRRPRKDPSERREEQERRAREHLQAGLAALNDGRPQEALRQAKQADEAHYRRSYRPAQTLRARAYLAQGRPLAILEDRSMKQAHRLNLLRDDDFSKELIQQLKQGDPVQQVRILTLMARSSEPRKKMMAYLPVLEELVGASDRAVAVQSVHVLGSWHPQRWRARTDAGKRVKHLLRRIAKGDDEQLAAIARGYIGSS